MKSLIITISLVALTLTSAVGCSRRIGNQPMPDYVHRQGQAFTAPIHFNFNSSNPDQVMVPLAGNFCGVVGYSMAGNTGDQHNINVIPATGMWHGHISGTATMDVECAPCTNFNGIASCAGGLAAGFQTNSNGMTTAPIGLEGSHIWEPGHFLVVNQGIGFGGGSQIDLFGLTPPLQGFGVSSQSGATVTGNAFGVQFLNGSGQAVSPQFDATLFYFQTIGGALVDLGRDDAGQCWLANDIGNAIEVIYVNTASPPHKILDSTRVGTNRVLGAFCLAYSF